MPISRQTKIVLVSVVGLAALALVAQLLISYLYPRDLRSQLAQILGVRPDVLWINLPPAKNRLPGSAFVIQQTLLAVDSVQVDSSEFSSGSEFDVDWVNSTGSKLNASSEAGFLGFLYGNSGNFRVDLRAARCRSIELSLDKLKQRLLKSDEVKTQAAQGAKPLVVVRSYEGLVTLRIRRTSSTTVDAWQKAQAAAKETASYPNSKIAVQGGSGDILEVTFKEPIVFAYEMVAAKLIATHLGAEPNDVQFESVPEPDAASEGDAVIPAPRTSSVVRPWALATVAVSNFPKTAWLTQSWNQKSAEAVESTLQHFGPTSSMHYRSSANEPSNANTLLNSLTAFAHQAKDAGARLMVVYYVGHSVTTSNGDILLLQGGVTPQFLKRAGAEQRAPPSNNLGDLMRVVTAATLADREQALDLKDLHTALKAVELPFVILLDGCMDNTNVRRAIEASGFRYDAQNPTTYYVGPEPLTQHLISRIGDSLKDFGALSPYLHDANPVVFAAKPGTLALISAGEQWEGSPPLAPLAQKFRRIAMPSASGNVESLFTLIARSIDMREGVGELELTGSITWSDFSSIERLAQAIIPVNARLPYSHASEAVVKLHKPRVGVIEGFHFSRADKHFYLVSQGNDWKFWRWNAASGRQLIVGDPRFPQVSGTPNGTMYFHHDHDKTLARVTGERKLFTVRTGLYIERMAEGWAADELLVASEASSVDEIVPIYSIRGNSINEIGKLQTSKLLSLVALRPGIAFTREGANVVYLLVKGAESVLARNLPSPGQITLSGSTLFCLSRDKTRVYRIGGKQLAQAELVANDGARVIRGTALDGFQASPNGTLFITDYNTIVELDPEKLVWTPLEAGSAQ